MLFLFVLQFYDNSKSVNNVDVVIVISKNIFLVKFERFSHIVDSEQVNAGWGKTGNNCVVSRRQT